MLCWWWSLRDELCVTDWREFQKPGGLAAAPCASLWAHICLAVLLEKAGTVDLSMAHCALSSAFSPVCYILHHAVFGSVEIHSTYPNKTAEYTANSAALLQGSLCTTPMIWVGGRAAESISSLSPTWELHFRLCEISSQHQKADYMGEVYKQTKDYIL
ncbi:hypothetical protein MHYP_G00136780 [Metynnis hypsauchen]